jgi:hypothetical protein
MPKCNDDAAPLGGSRNPRCLDRALAAAGVLCVLTGADATAERPGAMTQRLLSIRFSTRYAVITRIEPGDPVNTDQWMPNCLVKPGNGWGQATMPLDQWRGRTNNPVETPPACGAL